MFALIDDSCHIVKILGRGFAVFVIFRIGNHYRRTRGGEMHFLPGKLQVMFWVLPMQGQVTAAFFHRFFDHRPWKP